MRVTAPVTDYIRASVMSVRGDLAVRGALVPERLPAGADKTYFQGKGAGVIPAYDVQMPPLLTHGDLLTQGATVPVRIGTSTYGGVLTTRGAGNTAFYFPLFQLLTTRGDLWVRGVTNPQRLAAGALDTYLKAQGAGLLPIYEKLHLKDTGVKVDSNTRSTSGNQSITGVGFKPSAVVFIASESNINNLNWSIGFCDNLLNAWSINQYDNGTKIANNNFLAQIRIDVANYLRAVVDSMDSDGFTITWTLGGSCQAYFIYLCLP